MPGNIHVLMFDDINGAENMLDNVTSWEKAGWLKIEDAVVVTRGSGSETPPLQMATASGEQARAVPATTNNTELEIKQTHKFAGKYALGGSGIGFLAGMLLGGPIGGGGVRATLGALTAALKDYGIDDKFIKEVSASVRPGTSALFLMSSGGDAEKLLPEIREHKARLLSTTLPPEQERALREALEKHD
ncbi:MAG TPA: DUF1269 domain-containing protein [Caldilineaceae bacterium]|nr:DUF1269 domain-containing protein [Caldilineaceae bacterium]